MLDSKMGREWVSQARKTLLSAETRENLPAGAKTHRLLSATYGTTKVVPCYKAVFLGSL
jgi:hypothetical protein